MAHKYFHPDSDFFRKVLHQAAPEAIAHATEEEILQNMKRLQPKSWILRGNVLEGMTEQGKLVQTIPPDYILEGTDEKGLPKFRKIVL
jgi:hypothetical protein